MLGVGLVLAAAGLCTIYGSILFNAVGNLEVAIVALVALFGGISVMIAAVVRRYRAGQDKLWKNFKDVNKTPQPTTTKEIVQSESPANHETEFKTLSEEEKKKYQS